MISVTRLSPLLLELAAAVSPVLSFAATVFLAAIAMRWLPARPPKFKEALVGGAASAILLVGLKVGLAQFLKHTQVGDFYGSALTLVLVLFWIYFAMQAFLYGSELAAELADERHTREAEMELESAGQEEASDINTLAGPEVSEVDSGPPEQQDENPDRPQE